MSKVLLILANGFEDVEACTPIDVMRRAEIHVEVAGLGSNEIRSAHGLKVTTDSVLSNQSPDDYDMLVLPGGGDGADNIYNSSGAIEIIKAFAAADKHVAAICASPYILGALGLLDGRDAVCYPQDIYIEKLKNAKYHPNQYVAVDGKFITGAGPGAAAAFSREIVKTLKGSDTADALWEGMLFSWKS